MPLLSISRLSIKKLSIKAKLPYLLLGFALTAGQTFSQVEEVLDETLIDGKTPEQIVEEYSRWSSTKNDWPWLAHFREDNEKLTPPTKDEKRVVFMGDSITQGWSDASPEFFADKPYIERGISGQTTPQMLLRFQADVIALEPSVVVILAGTNDLAENTGPASNEMIQDNLASMAQLAKVHGIKVIMSSILPVYDYPWKPDMKPSQRIIDINAWMFNYCEKNGHTYLDYFSSVVDERKGMNMDYSYDGVHANKAGYTIMEGLVEEAIKEALHVPIWRIWWFK